MSWRYFLWIIVVVLVISNLVIWVSVIDEAKDPVLEVAFLNVGQGDSILIKSPSGAQMLVDGGAKSVRAQRTGRADEIFR